MHRPLLPAALLGASALLLASSAWTQDSASQTDEPGAVWAPAATGNFAPGNRPAERAIDRVVIHDIEGSAEGAVRWFQNPQARVSAHYVLDATGTRLWQQVRERDVAWHAGNADVNARSIGIEHEGYAYRPGFYNREMYEASARLVRSITARHAIPRDREHVIAHAWVPHPTDPTKRGGRSGHTDPGPYWDWDYYFTLIRNDARLDTLTAPAVIRPGEKLTVLASLTNLGDDPWPAVPAQGRIDPAKSPVYLAVQPDRASPERVQSPLYDRTGWVSPRYAALPVGTVETFPGAAAAFSFPVLGPRTLGAVEEELRLTRVPVAPNLPVPFGPTFTLRMRVEPWDLLVDGASPQFEAPGWTRSEVEGRPVFTRRFEKRGAGQEPARWRVSLPISGEWEVHARMPEVPGRARRAVYTLTTAEGEKRVEINPRKDEGWRSLGRFQFSGARPEVTVTLAAAESASGTVAADALRFVGPFPGSEGSP